jgi:adenosylcobinamide kinase/adenosylcobinamide-phosphate guanylyltransferase
MLVLGGCRSGKSRHALELADRLRVRRKCFVATCVPADAEMARRVEGHQAERDSGWQTLEEPCDLAGAIAGGAAQAEVILIDCLTLWVSNLLLGRPGPDPIAAPLAELLSVLAAPPCPLILVANEVGMGIVPDNPLARRFRDAAGRVNAAVAAACDHVALVVAGIPMTVKGLAPGTPPRD